MTDPPKIVAEVGCNHRGDMDTVRELVMAAAQFCKADVVKFQKRCPPELLTQHEFNAPHPNPMHAYAENMVAMYLPFPLLLQPAQVPPNSEKGQAATGSRYDWADVIPRAERLLNSSVSRVEAGGSA